MNAAPIDTRSADGRRLRLLDGGRRSTVDDAPAVEAFAVRCRAGDRHEPCTLQPSSALAELATALSREGIDFELGVRLCIETALAAADLRAAGVDPEVLDRAASRVRVGGELDARDAAYLRRLTPVSPYRPQPTAAGVTVGLPVRLTARLLSASIDALLAAADPVRARAWELSALLEGRTISEWAPLAALRELGAAERV